MEGWDEQSCYWFASGISFCWWGKLRVSGRALRRGDLDSAPVLLGVIVLTEVCCMGRSIGVMLLLSPSFLLKRTEALG